MEMEISGSRQKPSTIQKTLSVRPRRTLALLPHCRLGRAGGSPFLICASCCGPPRRSIWHRGGWGCWCSNRCRGCRGSGGRSGCASCPSCLPGRVLWTLWGAGSWSLATVLARMRTCFAAGREGGCYGGVRGFFYGGYNIRNLLSLNI